MTGTICFMKHLESRRVAFDQSRRAHSGSLKTDSGNESARRGISRGSRRCAGKAAQSGRAGVDTPGIHRTRGPSGGWDGAWRGQSPLGVGAAGVSTWRRARPGRRRGPESPEPDRARSNSRLSRSHSACCGCSRALSRSRALCSKPPPLRQPVGRMRQRPERYVATSARRQYTLPRTQSAHPHLRFRRERWC